MTSEKPPRLPDLHSSLVQHEEMQVHQAEIRAQAAERLRKARARAKFPGPTEAANRFGWTLSTYYSHENGSRGFSKSTAITYAKAFRVNLEWLISGEGSPDTGSKIRVEGYIGAGAVIHALESQDDYGMDEIEAPFGPPEEFVAFVVRGDSNYPAYQDREVVICRRDGLPIADVVGRECAVRLIDGRRLLKKVVAGSSKALFTLLSFNHPPMLDEAIVWASPVEWVKKS